mgnify:CR=1 FL=1
MAKSTAKHDGGLVETIKTVVYALLIAGVFRTLFFQPFWIPSGSMKDTLLIGDFLFVNKMAYGYSRYSCPGSACPFSGRLLASDPERGDVVVFRHPTAGTDYIKRLIGLPLEVERAGYRTIMWDVEDQPEKFTEPQAYANDILARVRPGSIILIHPMYRTNQVARDALPFVLDGLQKRGYEVVTISELLERTAGADRS